MAISGHRRAAKLYLRETRASSLHQAGYDIHGQCEHGHVEKERGDAVHRRQAADRFAGDLHVGDLRGHGYDQRVIEKVPIVRVLLAGKQEPAGVLFGGRAIEFARIVQRENPVQERPGQKNRAHTERDLIPTGRMAELDEDRSEAGERGTLASTRSAMAPSSLIAARWRMVATDACAAVR